METTYSTCATCDYHIEGVACQNPGCPESQYGPSRKDWDDAIAKRKREDAERARMRRIRREAMGWVP